MDLHADHNQWKVRRARQELARRGARELLPELLKRTLQANNPATAREVLWTYFTLQNPSPDTDSDFMLAAPELLDSPHAVVRRWTVRFLGDCGGMPSGLSHRLDTLAEKELDVHVRSQLAASAARIPAKDALPIINANINRDIDTDDPFIPLQWWWAVERHSLTGREEIMRRFMRPTLWKSKLGRNVLMPRLVRRYMAEGSEKGLDCVLQLLEAAPEKSTRDLLWPAVLAGWQEMPNAQRRDKVAADHPLTTYIQSQWSAKPDDSALARLALALGNEQVRVDAVTRANAQSYSPADRLAALALLSEYPNDRLLSPMLDLFRAVDQPEAIRTGALRVLARIDDQRVADAILQQLARSQPLALVSLEHETLFSRRAWALTWLKAVDRDAASKELVSLEQVRRLALLDDRQIDQLVTKHWGKLNGASPEEKLAEVRRLNNDLRAGKGDAATGYLLFKKHCAVCHRMDGQGGTIGPDLTSANRQDREFLLLSLVDPNLVIRREYMSIIVRTEDDRVFTGIGAPSSGGGVKLVTAKNETVELAADEIAEVQQSSVSLMPEDLVKQLSPQELRDLFAFLATPVGP